MTFHPDLAYYRVRAAQQAPDVAHAIHDLCDEIDRLRAEHAAFKASLLVHLPCAHCGQDVCATDERGKPSPDVATCQNCRAEHSAWGDAEGAITLDHDCDHDFCGYDGHDELGEP